MKHKIKIKKFVDDSSLTCEERYNKLQAHHLEETVELIHVIQELEAELEFFGEAYYESYEIIDGDDWF